VLRVHEAGPGEALMNRAERDDLVQRIRAAADAAGEAGLSMREDALRRERLLVLVGEYADRLPRPVLSIDPFTRKPYRRTFDPFGVDGPYWDARTFVETDDPDPGPSFRVLLGGLDLRGRTPSEVSEQVRPGPPVPFVVPALLALPGMVAVIGRLTFATGDIGYPIAYFADQPTDPAKLHQEWARLDFWFQRPGEDAGWLSSNYRWDFDLEPWIAQGKVLWVEPDLDTPEATLTLRRGTDPGAACPYVGLPGTRAPQQILGGELDLLKLPSGVPLSPFDE
jgi:hypothetical protein